MDYQLIIFISKKTLSAIDIDKSGHYECISIDGNSSMQYTQLSNIANFCGFIKNNYNIDSFSELSFSMLILNVGAPDEYVWELNNNLNGSADRNILNADKLIPIIMLANNKIRANVTLTIKFLDCYYEISANAETIIECKETNIADFDIELEISEFKRFYCLIANELKNDEEALKKKDTEIRQKNDEIKKLTEKLNTLQTNFDNLRQENDNLKKQSADNLLKIENYNKMLSDAGRYIVKASGITTLFPTSSEPYAIADFFVTYEAEHSTIIKRGNPIAILQRVNLSNFGFGITEINSPADGKVFLLLDNGTNVKDGMDIAIIGNENDTQASIMAWYNKKQKLKER